MFKTRLTLTHAIRSLSHFELLHSDGSVIKSIHTDAHTVNEINDAICKFGEVNRISIDRAPDLKVQLLPDDYD